MAPLAELERLYGEPADAWEQAAGAKEAQSASEGTTAAGGSRRMSSWPSSSRPQLPIARPRSVRNSWPA